MIEKVGERVSESKRETTSYRGERDRVREKVESEQRERETQNLRGGGGEREGVRERVRERKRETKSKKGRERGREKVGKDKKQEGGRE